MTDSVDRNAEDSQRQSAMGASCKRITGHPTAQRQSTSSKHSSGRKIDNRYSVDDFVAVQHGSSSEEIFWIANVVGINVNAENVLDRLTAHWNDAFGNDDWLRVYHLCFQQGINTRRLPAKLQRNYLRNIGKDDIDADSIIS